MVKSVSQAGPVPVKFTVPRGPLSIRVQMEMGLIRYPWGAPNHQALVGFARGRKSVAIAIPLTFLQTKVREGAGTTRHWVQVRLRKKHIEFRGKKVQEEGRIDFEGGWFVVVVVFSRTQHQVQNIVQECGYPSKSMCECMNQSHGEKLLRRHAPFPLIFNLVVIY